jgi:hypothetical protein
MIEVGFQFSCDYDGFVDLAVPNANLASIKFSTFGHLSKETVVVIVLLTIILERARNLTAFPCKWAFSFVSGMKKKQEQNIFIFMPFHITKVINVPTYWTMTDPKAGKKKRVLI